MIDTDFRDRRIFARLSLGLPFRFLELSSKREGQGQTHDISAKGVGIVTNTELAPHTPLDVWLEVPDKGRPLYARGKVAWAHSVNPNEWRAGIDLEKEDLMGMSRIMRTQRRNG